jgi:predicted metal-binding membrane protein
MRDQGIVIGGIAALTLLCWIYLGHMAGEMNAMAVDALAMPDMQMWTDPQVSMLIVMWTVMMIAMMLPSAAPVIVLAMGAYRRRTGRSFTREAVAFLAGYVIVWTAFSVLAALAQAGLHRAALLSPAMAASSAWFGGTLLMIAGVYQWSPLKHACLAHCRSPLHFVMTEWREGAWGALVMGLRHGRYCVGCCWALMAVLFVAGVMNLAWVAAIAVFVLVEKLARVGVVAGRVAGVALVLWGIAVLLRNA